MLTSAGWEGSPFPTCCNPPLRYMDAPGAGVSLEVPHLALDHFRVVRRSMQYVSVATVHRHVGYSVVRTVLPEEDQVTTLEVGLCYPLAVLVPKLFCRILVPILFRRIVRQLDAEVTIDKPCKARAVF